MYYMSVGRNVCVHCRINNLDGSAAEEAAAQTWLKLWVAALERSKHEREMSVMMFCTERSHVGEERILNCSTLIL